MGIRGAGARAPYLATLIFKLTYVTRCFGDTTLNLVRRRADILERDDYWVVCVTEWISEIVVLLGNVYCWNVISYNVQYNNSTGK